MTVHDVFRWLFIACIAGVLGFGAGCGFLDVPEGESCDVGGHFFSFFLGVPVALIPAFGLWMVEENRRES